MDTLEVSKSKGITKNTIKIIAIVTMFIDHFAAVILETAMKNVSAEGLVTIGGLQLSQGIVSVIDIVMRLIGRIAFPIFCYSLVEGLNYTKSKCKYLLRLFVFALISEIPFDLAFHQKVFYFDYQNVIFTMFIGLLVMMLLQLIEKKLGRECKNPGTEKQVIGIVLQLGALLSGIAIAELCKTDYSGSGVLAIAIMYYLREKRTKKAMIASFFGTMLLLISSFSRIQQTITSLQSFLPNMKIDVSFSVTIVILFAVLPAIIAFIISLFGKNKNKDVSALGGGIAILTYMNLSEITAFFGLIPMVMYNQESGKKSAFMKYFFYVFYPAHILLIYLLGLALHVCQFSFF